MRTAAYKSTEKETIKLLILPAKIWRYMGIFLAVVVVFMVTFERFEGFYSFYFLKPVSLLGFYVLKFIGLPITYSADSLPLGYSDYILPNRILRVNFGCTGIYVYFVYIAAVAAYPAGIRSKLFGMLAGTPLFMLYSALRLVVMGLVGYMIPQRLDIIHSYLMVVINIAFMLWLYTWWMDRADRKDLQ